MFKQKPIEEILEKIKIVGNQLVPYNFPVVPPLVLENELNLIKQKEFVVDGYSVVLHFNRSDYTDHYLEILQVHAKYGTFLPFAVVAKLAKCVLGSHGLSLVEIFKDDRKVYCWSIVLDKSGRPVDVKIKKSKVCVHEGLQYNLMNPKQVNFY